VIEITPPVSLTIEETKSGLQIFERSLSDIESGKVDDEEVAAFAGW
jgi:hypothetical protein